MTERAKRVLIYRLGSLGDTVVALPALHLVARAFPDAERRLLTNFPVNVKAPSAASILENTGLVDGYFRYAVGTRSPAALAALWWKLARWRPEVLVYLGAARGVAAAKRDAAFFRLCGVRRLIGVPETEEMQRNRVEDDGSLEYEAARLVRNLAELGSVDLDDPANWDLRLTEEERARAGEAVREAAGRAVIAAGMGTKRQSKDWGIENWRALLGVVAGECPGHALVLLGSAEEAAASEHAAEPWRRDGGVVINLCGKLTPRESAAVLARARAFVGHDSGPMHLAAAVGIPCVAVFSARNRPRVWFPCGAQHRVVYHKVDCWGCNLETCVVEKKKCMTSITVPEVLKELRVVLG